MQRRCPPRQAGAACCAHGRTWPLVSALLPLLLVAGAHAALTGLALPPLGVPPSQFGGAWASASSFVFTDLMKHSTPFVAGSRSASASGNCGWLDPKSLTMRADGYPAGLSPPNVNTVWCVTTTIGAGWAYYPAGRYVVLYDGSGTVELDGDAAVVPGTSVAGRLVANVTPSATGIRLRITASSPANPVVNVRVVPEAYEATYATTQVFRPEFLNLLKGVPLLRCAAWMQATSNTGSSKAAPRNWSRRTTPTHSSQVRDEDGVAIEHLVLLANTVNASMWISLPRAANESDPYVLGVVSYIAANLATELSLTLEYGTDGPGWLSTELPTATKLLSKVARSAWAAAGRPAGQLRVVQVAPIINAVGNILGQLDQSAPDYAQWLDAVALPASFAGMAYFTWAGRDNPTAWGDPGYFANSRPLPSLDDVLTLMRSSVIAADVSYNKQYQVLRGRGLQVLGYAAGLELTGPTYGARANFDRASGTCNSVNTVWPCTFNTLYPPWGYSGGPSSITWTSAADRNVSLSGAPAANATREAALESLLRQARTHPSVYGMVRDSLWRWHKQMGGGDVVVDVARQAQACSSAPGSRIANLYAPDECRTGGQALVVASPADSPTYQALTDWLAAVAAGSEAAAPGADKLLPRSSADAPPPTASPKQCSPACVYGTCSPDGLCVCWAGASGATCDTLAPRSTPSACNPRLGINLEGIADWSRSWTFVDVFKVSREWISQDFHGGPWSNNRPLPLVTASDSTGGRTAVGYPASLDVDQKASTLAQRDLAGHVPGGIYTVLYDGKGALDFGLDVKDVVHVAPGYIRINVTPSTDFNNGILVMIERTDPADPIRNIRVLMPGFEAAAMSGNPFHPSFLSFLRPFGVLRFMDWMRTNTENVSSTWDTRPTADDRSYAQHPGGVPLEVMVQLANTLGADPWFNMPHAATDDYISRFAAAVRDKLRPDVKVYVEYSNEVWHTGFPGGRYAQSMGLLLNMTEQGNAWYGGATNEARLCFAAARTANISALWKAQWAAAGRAQQVVVVVSGQGVWPITSSKLLSCRNAYQSIDALAIAPYFGEYVAARDKSLPLFLNTTIPDQINQTMSLVAQHAAIAAQYGKPLLAYEAGQGMVGDGSSNDLAIQANRDPGMAQLYSAYLAGLAANNVTRTVHFSSIGAFSRYGSWGLTEWQDADPRDAPKLQAVLAYINATATCPLPAGPDPATCPNQCNGNGDCLPGGKCACYNGFSGTDCGDAKYQEVYNCGYKCTFDQGFCNVTRINRFTRTWSCSCKPGMTGLTCSIVSCPNNCNGNGECIDQGVCACYPGYRGANCSVDCGCGGHGRCDDAGACICDVGWRPSATGGCEWDCSGCAEGTECIGPGECGCAEDCVYGDCFAGACRCWAGYGGAACNISDSLKDTAAGKGIWFVPRANRGSFAGINLGGLAYWSTEWVWLDVMKGSSAWMTANAEDTALENPWDTGVALELRSDGYPARLPPKTIAHKLLLRNVLLHAWPGRYVMLWDGDGRLDVRFDATVASRDKNRLEFIFNPTADLACAATGAAYCGDNGIHLRLLATNPANPVRNIRILPSAAPPASSAGGAGAGGAWEARASRAPFHPWFLKSIARYRVIRFMTWQSTNENKTWGTVATAWTRKTQMAQDTQARSAGGGVAIQYMAQLCNIIGADLWLSIHHLADNTYVNNLAKYFKAALRPDLKVYVEFSNEVWNPLFPQNAYARARGLALNLSADPAIAGYRYHALRTVSMRSILRSTFATAPGGGASRVKTVLGGWGYLCNGGTGCGAVVMRETLGWSDTASKVSYYGVTGYWGCGLGANGPKDVLLSVDDMLARCNATLNATEADAKALASAAAPYGVPLITYEAGPSIVESSAIERGSATTGLAAKYIAVNRHPQMYDLYTAYLAAFVRAGFVGSGRPWMQFVSTALPTQYGSWGLQEYTGQPTAEAPKYRALMDWIDSLSGVTPRPLCLSLSAVGGKSGGVSGTAGGGIALGEGVLQGPPAVQLPAAGQVLVQGRNYTVQWSTVGAPPGPSPALNVTLWYLSDCATAPPTGKTQQKQQKPSSQALLVLASKASLSPNGQLSWRVPLPAELPALKTAVQTVAAVANTTGGQRPSRFFLRISDGVTTNYSEPFDIQPPYVYVAGSWGSCDCAFPTPKQRRTVTCTSNAAASSAPPDLSPPATSPVCDPFPAWNLTRPSNGDPWCRIDTQTGCREYRTSNQGAWRFSVFKPVVDCTSQASPWPAPTGWGSAEDVPVASNLCVAAGSVAPSAERSCADTSQCS